MQVQNIQLNNYQNFKSKVEQSWQLKGLQMIKNGKQRELLEKYINIINKGLSGKYYKYIEENGQPIICSDKIGSGMPIEVRYKLNKDPLELFRTIAGIEVGYSSMINPKLYTEAEKKLVEPEMFVIG